MIDRLRLTFISFEFASLLAAWTFWRFHPGLLSRLTPLLTANENLYLAILGAPLVMLLPAYKLARDVLFPLSNSRPLAQWPDYHLLVRRVYFAMAVVVACSLGSVITMLTWKHLSARTVAVLTISTLAPAVCSIVSLAFASFATKKAADELEHIETKSK